MYVSELKKLLQDANDFDIVAVSVHGGARYEPVEKVERDRGYKIADNPYYNTDKEYVSEQMMKQATKSGAFITATNLLIIE